MRVNYGRQNWYRLHHTEPACKSCEHLTGKESDGKYWCAERDWWTDPNDLCLKYDREPGTD